MLETYMAVPDQEALWEAWGRKNKANRHFLSPVQIILQSILPATYPEILSNLQYGMTSIFLVFKLSSEMCATCAPQSASPSEKKCQKAFILQYKFCQLIENTCCQAHQHVGHEHMEVSCDVLRFAKAILTLSTCPETDTCNSR